MDTHYCHIDSTLWEEYSKRKDTIIIKIGKAGIKFLFLTDEIITEKLIKCRDKYSS